MCNFITKRMDEHTHADGTTHTHADGTTHTHADGTTHTHEGNKHTKDQFNAKKEMLLKQLLTSEARLRLNNVKMVKPELANMVENYLLGLASQGRTTGQITDEQLKQILLSAQQPKKDFKINRI
jgi:programmed cell death protein 5